MPWCKQVIEVRDLSFISDVQNKGFSGVIFWNISTMQMIDLFIEFHISVCFSRCIPHVTQRNEGMDVHCRKYSCLSLHLWVAGLDLPSSLTKEDLNK